jgi:hypothetical protein
VSDERPLLPELEVRLKEQEIRLRETETRAKERQIDALKWVPSLVSGIVLAVIGLIGSLIANVINNANTLKLEQFRAQSNLILEAIKTNGDTSAACKNLVFFTSLGLIEDRSHTITGACPGNVQGAPSVSVVGPADRALGFNWYPLNVQVVDQSGAPIPDASVEGNLIPPEFPIPPDLPTGFLAEIPSCYLGVYGRSGHCVTGNNGSCALGMVPAGRFVAVLAKKNGYAGNRTNAIFTGTSVSVVLQNQSPNH